MCVFRITTPGSNQKNKVSFDVVMDGDVIKDPVLTLSFDRSTRSWSESRIHPFGRQMIASIASTRQKSLQDVLEGTQHVYQSASFSALVFCAMLGRKKELFHQETRPWMTRQERRRFQADHGSYQGRAVKFVRIGDLGKVHLKAMGEEERMRRGDAGARRAHWVRGHMMFTPTKGFVWRNPHIRGGGPVQQKELRVKSGGELQPEDWSQDLPDMPM